MPLIHYQPCANISTSRWNNFLIMNALVIHLMPRMLEDGYSYENVSMNKVFGDLLDNQNNLHLEIPSALNSNARKCGNVEMLIVLQNNMIRIRCASMDKTQVK